jgi:hypothetical protein
MEVAMSLSRFVALVSCLIASSAIAGEPVKPVREPARETAAIRSLSPADTALREVAAVESEVAELVASHDRYEASAVRLADLIRSLSETVDRTTRTLTTRPRPGEAAQAAALRALAKKNDALQEEFLAIKNAMQMESRRFHAVSSALKVRHDTAKAAINNLR